MSKVLQKRIDCLYDLLITITNPDSRLEVEEEISRLKQKLSNLSNRRRPAVNTGGRPKKQQYQNRPAFIAYRTALMKRLRNNEYVSAYPPYEEGSNAEKRERLGLPVFIDPKLTALMDASIKESAELNMTWLGRDAIALWDAIKKLEEDT